MEIFLFFITLLLSCNSLTEIKSDTSSGNLRLYDDVEFKMGAVHNQALSNDNFAGFTFVLLSPAVMVLAGARPYSLKAILLQT